MSVIKLAVMMAMFATYQTGTVPEVPSIRVPPVQEQGWSTYYDLSDASMNGAIMANGKPFKPGDISIASRHIPLGTFVLLEHVGTGNRVWAEVTDRGPYGAMHGGEWVLKIKKSDPGTWRGVADLSYGAAMALTDCDCKRPPNSDIRIRHWGTKRKRVRIAFAN